MKLRINQLKLPLDYARRPLKYYAARALRVAEDEITGVHLVKRSVDARDKSRVHFSVTLDVDTQRAVRPLPREPRPRPVPRWPGARCSAWSRRRCSARRRR